GDGERSSGSDHDVTSREGHRTGRAIVLWSTAIVPRRGRAVKDSACFGADEGPCDNRRHGGSPSEGGGAWRSRSQARVRAGAPRAGAGRLAGAGPRGGRAGRRRLPDLAQVGGARRGLL